MKAAAVSSAICWYLAASLAGAQEPDAEAAAPHSAAEGEVFSKEVVEPWSLHGAHLVVSAERLSSVVSWNEETTGTLQSYYYVSSGDAAKVKTTGVDVSVLGAGGAVRSPSSLPRLAFDGVLDMGFSFGGAVGYMGSAGETQLVGGGSAKLDNLGIFVFAPRIGALLRPSSTLGIWLRGGISHTSVVSTGTFTGVDGSAIEVEETATLWHLSMEPQLVLVAAPHVAFTISGLLDIGLPGRVESKLPGSGSTTAEQTTSAYGVSAGMAAIF